MSTLARVKRGIEAWLKVLPLVLGAACLVWFWLHFPHNYRISDPWQYARHAYLVATGTYFKTLTVPDVFGQRLGVFVPVALVYVLLGVTPHSTALVPLLAGLATLLVVWQALPNAAALPGVVWTVTCVPLLRGTIELYPDLIATAFMMISTLMLARRLEAPNRHSTQLLRAGVGVACWFAAMLAKESAYWVLPLWAGAALVDAVRRRGPTLKWFHAPAILFGLLLTAAYLGFCSHFFGDALSRVHSVDALTGQHVWSIRKPGQLAARLGSGPARFFWREYGLLLVAAVPGLFVLPAKLWIWSFYTVLSVLCYWFGSTSLSSYQPLPLIWRMSLPCAPGFCIVAGYFCYWISSLARRWLGPRWAFVPLAATSALAVLVMAPPVAEELRAGRVFPDLEAMAIVEREVKSHPAVRYLLVSAESRTNDYVSQCLGFAPPANATLVYAGALDEAALAGADAAILIVDPRNHRVANDRTKSYASQILALRLPVLFHRGNVGVFQSNELSRLSALRSHRE